MQELDLLLLCVAICCCCAWRWPERLEDGELIRELSARPT
jgi:hypothetical protein